jgi:hypothetical protein
MSKFKKDDRVLDDYLGAGSVVRPIKSGLDSRMIIAYIVLFDKTPDVRYNMGENPCMVFTGSLKVE